RRLPSRGCRPRGVEADVARRPRRGAVGRGVRVAVAQTTGVRAVGRWPAARRRAVVRVAHLSADLSAADRRAGRACRRVPAGGPRWPVEKLLTKEQGWPEPLP